MTDDTDKFLDISELSVAFGDSWILEHIDLAVKKGEFITIVGPSGCGKSTLLNVISGILNSENSLAIGGSIRFIGAESRVAYGFQTASLLPWFTVKRNVMIGAKLGRREGNLEQIAIALLKRVGLEESMNAYPSTLSGGMRQRVALARVLANDADLILLDEPFGALDAFTRLDMQNLVSELWAEMGKTIILVTHDLEEALILGTRVVLMSPRPGRITMIMNNSEWGIPRDAEALRTDARFAEQVRHLWEYFRTSTKRNIDASKCDLGGGASEEQKDERR